MINAAVFYVGKHLDGLGSKLFVRQKCEEKTSEIKGISSALHNLDIGNTQARRQNLSRLHIFCAFKKQGKTQLRFMFYI